MRLLLTLYLQSVIIFNLNPPNVFHKLINTLRTEPPLQNKHFTLITVFGIGNLSGFRNTGRVHGLVCLVSTVIDKSYCG